MIWFRTLGVTAVFLICSALAGAADRPAPAISVPEYIAQLDRILAEADSLNEHPENGPILANTIPLSWTVAGEDGTTFRVPTEWVRSELQKVGSGKAYELPKIRERLHAMRAAAGSYRTAVADNAGERSAVNAILARREFKNVRGRSWWDALKARIQQWLFRLLSRIFGSSAFPKVARWLVWALIGTAVLFVGLAVFRAIRRNAGVEGIVIDAQPVSAKSWNVWLAEARLAATRGEWRDAVHLAYWAGISLLEDRGMWRPDRARTPREYLRLLPSESEHRAALSALTRRFEVVWYGYSTADEQAFSQTLAELEKLGCR